MDADCGADIHAIKPYQVLSDEEGEDSREPSLELLELLWTRGWDINPDRPLLWSVLPWPRAVNWCLDHGSVVTWAEQNKSTTAEEQETRSKRREPLLLELAASSATISTFELLLKHGAPLNPSTSENLQDAPTLLHYAAMRGEGEIFTMRLDMLRYLVAEHKLDVNAIFPNSKHGCTTPLCGVAYIYSSSKHLTALIWFFLDEGANPNIEIPPNEDCWVNPLQCARRFNNDFFLEAVETWQINHTPKVRPEKSKMSQES